MTVTKLCFQNKRRPPFWWPRITTTRGRIWTERLPGGAVVLRAQPQGGVFPSWTSALGSELTDGTPKKIKYAHPDLCQLSLALTWGEGGGHRGEGGSEPDRPSQRCSKQHTFGSTVWARWSKVLESGCDGGRSLCFKVCWLQLSWCEDTKTQFCW